MKAKFRHEISERITGSKVSLNFLHLLYENCILGTISLSPNLCQTLPCVKNLSSVLGAFPKLF